MINQTSYPCNLYLSNVECLYLFHDLKLLSIKEIEDSTILYEKFYSIYGLDFVKEYVVYKYFK